MRAVGGHLLTDCAGEHFRFLPSDAVAAAWLQRRHDMDAFASRRFAEGDEAEFLHPFAQFERCFYDLRKVDVRPRVEVEDQTPGDVGFEWCAIPGVKFERRDLPERYDALRRC